MKTTAGGLAISKNIQNKTITAGVILYKFVAKYAYYLTLMYLKIYLVVWEENSTYVFNAGISEKKKESNNNYNRFCGDT